MPIILFDNAERKKLYPFTQTRAVADLLMGAFTQKQRWQILSGDEVFILTEKYLQCLYRKIPEGIYLFIDASVVATREIIEKIFSLNENIALADEKGLVAGKINFKGEMEENLLAKFETVYDTENVKRLEYKFQIFQWNDESIRNDFSLITKNKISQKISSTNKIIFPENIFFEEGAVVEQTFLNASTGPIYIGKNATVMEGCFIRGPFVMCENSTLKMGAKLYGATTLGESCVGGGEIKNSVMQSFSNKAHDGYLGDSVIGSWCNLGAGTSNSNIKNTAENILLPDFFSNEKINVGNKCGVLMGEYTRVAINSSINTGSIFGVCCNIFGEGLLPKFIKNFTWGTKENYLFDKAMRDIDNWKKLKQQSINENEIAVLKYIFEQTKTNENL